MSIYWFKQSKFFICHFTRIPFRKPYSDTLSFPFMIIIRFLQDNITKYFTISPITATVTFLCWHNAILCHPNHNLSYPKIPILSIISMNLFLVVNCQIYSHLVRNGFYLYYLLFSVFLLLYYITICLVYAKFIRCVFIILYFLPTYLRFESVFL